MERYNVIFNDLIMEFNDITRKNIGDIEQELSINTPYQASSIRRYKREGYPGKKKMGALIKRIIEVGYSYNMQKDELERRLLDYCEEYYKRYDGNCEEGNAKICNYINTVYSKKRVVDTEKLDSKEVENIVEIDGLKEKIEKFCNRNDGKLLYIFGFPGTGLTRSVYKILEDKKEELVIISCEIESENDWKETLDSIKAGIKFVVVHLGNKKIPTIFFEYIAKKKIIVLANCPAKNYYDPRIDSVLFNDCCNNKKEINKMISEMMRNSSVINGDENDIKENLVDMFQVMTGGVPIAVRNIGHYIEKECQYVGDVKRVIKECAQCGNMIRENVLKNLFKNILLPVWNQLKEDTKTAVVKIIYFEGDVSIELWRYILNETPDSSTWRNVFDESIQNLILLESGRTIDTPHGETTNYGGIRFLPLVKTLLRSCYWNEEEKNKVYDKAVDYYLSKTKEANEKEAYIGKKIFLDRGKEMQVLIEVLNYCDEKHKDEEFLTITRNLRYFFYLRRKWWKEVESLYKTRIVIAERTKRHDSVMDTYAHLINMAVKYQEKSKAKEYKEKAEKYIANNHLEQTKTEAYRHAVALYETLINNNCEKALAIWDELLQEGNLSERDRLSAEKWRRKCWFKTEKKTFFGLLYEFSEGYDEARRIGFSRLTIDYALYQAYINLKLYYQYREKSYLDDATTVLDVAGAILLDEEYMGDKYKADYYATMCYIKKFKGENWDAELAEAQKYYSKQNTVSLYARLRENLEAIND